MFIEERTEKKMLVRVASVLFLLYFLFSVDRGNIGFAALQMNKALGLSAEVFGFGSGLFTLGYLLFQVPNAEWLRRVGASRGFAIIGCAWGLVSTSTAFVPDQFWFLLNRFALGVSEAGFHAFVIYYINRMFPSRIRGFAVGLAFVAVPISMVVASPLSGVLLNWQLGAMHGWQSLFIIEGIPSIVLGLLCLKLIPDSPSQIRFLSPDERTWLERDLGGASQQHKERGSMHGLKDAIGDPSIWALGFVLFTLVLSVNVMMIWMPQMIRQTSGAGNVQVGILNSVPWIAFGVGCVLVSRLSDRARNRMNPLRMSVAVAAIGFVIAAAAQDSQPLIGFSGFLLGAFGAGAAQAVFWTLTMQLVSGPSAATAYAVITLLGNGSGVFAHPLIGKLHDATGSFAGVVWVLAGFYIAAIATIYFIARRNGATADSAALANAVVHR
jgi:ACS family tartrate transporter-like MFS transporter